jgi:signal transduction histidine kinase
MEAFLTEPCPLAGPLAARLRAARSEITGRWLERLTSRVSVPPERVFPTDDLLDHMPLLVAGIADYLEDPARVVAADSLILHHARELGALRHTQGFSEYEILKEFEIFGAIIFSFVGRAAEELEPPGSRTDLMACMQRLFRAVSLLQQATTARFLELARTQVREREERLRAFNRALTHEMRNRIGAALGAGQLLQLHGLDGEDRERLANVVVRNAEGMRLVLENLLELSRLDPETRRERHVRLPAAAAEVARQLREASAAARVEIRIAPDLPDVEVAAAAVELALANLVSNAIKYADPAKAQRWVEIGALPGSDVVGELVVTVRDNGVGIPDAARARLFERFFRAHEASLPAVEGTGLGLSLVREAVEGIGGRVWAEPSGDGSLFALAIPCRRSMDLVIDERAGVRV